MAEATPKNGILESNDQLVITWAVNGADSVGSKSLSVDGKAVSTIYGPYSGGATHRTLAGELGRLRRHPQLQSFSRPTTRATRPTTRAISR